MQMTATFWQFERNFVNILDIYFFSKIGEMSKHVTVRKTVFFVTKQGLIKLSGFCCQAKVLDFFRQMVQWAILWIVETIQPVFERRHNVLGIGNFNLEQILFALFDLPFDEILFKTGTCANMFSLNLDCPHKNKHNL